MHSITTMNLRSMMSAVSDWPIAAHHMRKKTFRNRTLSISESCSTPLWCLNFIASRCEVWEICFCLYLQSAVQFKITLLKNRGFQPFSVAGQPDSLGVDSMEDSLWVLVSFDCFEYQLKMFFFSKYQNIIWSISGSTKQFTNWLTYHH